MESEWVFVDGTDSGAVFCERCGARLGFRMPISLRVYADALDDFRKRHAACKPREWGHRVAAGMEAGGAGLAKDGGPSQG